jgi:pilus assembly protein CpaB
MRSRTILIFALSVVAGGSVALMVSRSFRSEARASATMLVVAARPIAPGASLRAADLAEASWPAGRLPKGAFVSRDELLAEGGRVVLAAIDKDEPLTSWKLAAPGRSLSAQLSADLRAVSIRVDDVRGVAGFVLPGERVDVLLSRQAVGGRLTSDLLLRNVRVLAVDQHASEGQQRPAVARTVTLAVTPEEAQKVALGGELGKLSLALRRPDSADSGPGRTLSAADLDGTAPTPPEAPAPRDAGQTTVGIMRGTERSVYTVPRAQD